MSHEEGELKYSLPDGMGVSREIVGNSQLKNVSVDDITVNYKSTAVIKPEIEGGSAAKCKVTYSSSDTNIAKVDKDGTVHGIKRGSAVITCTVTDEYGNTVKDTCTVNVKFQWWQWLIWILLFGFLWYK